MRGNRFIRVLAGLAALTLVAAACTSDDSGDDGDKGQGSSSSLLQTVADRGRLVCGVNGQVPGFGFQDENGTWSGFDVEYCKAVAAAVLGDAEKVDYKPLEAAQRFTALQSGEIDVLIRNTTWTAKRDGAEGGSFATTTFYDGQGMMVNADSDFNELEDMGGTTICVLSGTTTELNLESQMKARNVNYTPLSINDNAAIQEAFAAGRCQGWTSDKSQLAGIRSGWPESSGGPDALRILDVTMSKEPLGPVIRDGDTKWFDAVNWAVLATIQAEEFGITKANVDQIKSESKDPEILRFLGVDVEGADPFDSGLGVPKDFAYQVIKQVGNYAEIYEATVGPNTPLGLERGVNSLWTDNGLLYAPPFR